MRNGGYLGNITYSVYTVLDTVTSGWDALKLTHVASDSNTSCSAFHVNSNPSLQQLISSLAFQNGAFRVIHNRWGISWGPVTYHPDTVPSPDQWGFLFLSTDHDQGSQLALLLTACPAAL